MRVDWSWKPSRRASALALGFAFAATLAFAYAAPSSGQEQDEDVPKPAVAKKPKNDKAGADKKEKKTTKRVPHTPPKSMKARGTSFDPLLDSAGNLPEWPYRFHVRTTSPELHGAVSLTYYPSDLGTKAGVVILAHEKNQGPADFEQSIKDLNDRSLAEALQRSGYGVLLVDLRPEASMHGGVNLNRRGYTASTIDLQIAYLFLLDRHNRGELNLSNLGVLGMGEGANLVASWASSHGAAVSGQDRLSDVAAIALISPAPDIDGTRIQPAIAALAPRFPLLLAAGERDANSAQVVKDGRVMIARVPQSKTELFQTSLHGFKLLRLWPKVASTIVRFFDSSSKMRSTEWEPRYNLTPLEYSHIEVVGGKANAAEAKDEQPANKADANKKR